MRSEFQARSNSLAWTNPVSWWWGMLTLVSGVNIAAWVLMYRQLHDAGTSGRAPGMDIMLLLGAAYVFGCAFRSFLPRADVQRICLFDTWLSSVAVGRSVATVAEVCFAAQWTMILLQLGTMSGATTAVNAAWVIVPLIVIAECFSWYAVVTTNYFFNAIENSIWAVAFFCRRHRTLPVVVGVRRRGSRGASRRGGRNCGLSGLPGDGRCADVSEALAGGRRRR